MILESLADYKKWQQHRRLPLETLGESPLLSSILSWWESQCRRQGRLVGRNTIDPTDLPREAFPYLTLIALEGPPDFRIRIVLAGEAVCALFGRNIKGAFSDELYRPQDYEIVRSDVLDMVAAREPLAVYREFVSRENRLVSFILLMVPLASDGTTIDGLLTVIDLKSPYRKVAF